MHTWYEDEAEVARRVAAGDHREIIGGMWEEIGQLQIDLLRAQGMAANHTLLDLGCGSGRLAVKAVPYLAPGRYYGIDISAALIGAARGEIEALGCGDRIDARTFHATDDFTPSADMPLFDFIVAQSLFTHLPIGQFGQALDAITGRLAPGGKFYATFFVAPYGTPELRHERDGITTYADHDPFHHPRESIVEQAIYRCWGVNWIGEWNHPRDQQMIAFTPPR